MIRERLLRRLKSSGGPAVWLAVARGCQVVGKLGIGRQRWAARTGYALRQAAQWDQATDAYVAAINGAAGNGDWRQLVERLEQGSPVDAPAAWLYYLGVCLRKLGETGGARQLIRAACRERPGNGRWLASLAQVEEQAGDVPAAVAALQQAVERGGDADPQVRLRLASLHAQVGEWAMAHEPLHENLRRHPDHGPSHRLLAEVVQARSLWGGTFSGTAAGRSKGQFQFGTAVTAGEPAAADQSLTAQARGALERAVALAPSRTAWCADLADARLADGDPAGAIQAYETALRAAKRSDGRWVLGAKQRWQFRLEQIHRSLGQGRVEDPLFDCTVESAGAEITGAHQVAGFFSARFTHVGLAISGFVAAAECDHVDIFLNGVPMRALNLSQDGHFPRFTLSVKRRTLALFPRQAEIEVRAGEAVLRAPAGAQRVRVTVPHGDGRLLEILTRGGKLDKKGIISPSADETRQRQERYLEIYSRVRDFFDQQLGRSVFLMYGTLLGFFRDGDFIPGDDDFDAGYVCDRTDPVAVKEETKDIIVALVRAGFTVSFNRRGRLFRVQLDRGATEGYHVDLRPLWFQAGNLWVHNHVCLPLTREDFLPVDEGTLRGVPVAAPRNTEAFLRGHYGPGWKVPDPGFTYYASEVDPAVRQNLNRALITVAEYKKLAERIRREVGDSPGAGRFVSVGSQDLYPLEEYIS